MNARRNRLLVLGVALALTGGVLVTAARGRVAPPRPQGPCDIYGAAGTPCVAAHSTTRALYSAYGGPLYQVKRESDGTTLDIGLARPIDTSADPGGYADAAAQDAFCGDTICVITRIYDQSGKGNDLYQAPPGPSFKGPAKGAFDTQPMADMAPITIGAHKAYGVYIMPGMGFRNNDATDLAINDEPEGIYYVIDGTHYDSGCCFDYGNASTNGRAVGTGTMETTYFGTATAWGTGNGPGPWIMSDMEAGLFSGYNAKQNVADPTVSAWRFVTAVVDGGGGNAWDLRGGNAQQGGLTTFYSGVRPGSRTGDSYFPMRRQGAILLGTGGDNGNGSSGTFYEGVMTRGYPTEATTDAVQANIVAARYDVPGLILSRVTTFTPGSSQDVTATFTNTAGTPATGVALTLSAPPGWTILGSGAGPSTRLSAPVAPGASVSATFKVTSPTKSGADHLTGTAEWTTTAAAKQSDRVTARVRNVLPIKINEVRFGTGTNPTNQFIELYNASDDTVDLSDWALIHTPSQWAPVVLARIPAGTSLAGHAYYVLGASSSGLAAPASAGAITIHVRSTEGFSVGQPIDVDGESRRIVRVGTAATAMTTVFVPVSTGPWLTIPEGSTNLPVTNATGFAVGEPIGIDLGGQYQLATVTHVGKAATQTTLAAEAPAGANTITLVADADIAVGDRLTVGTGGRKEQVAVVGMGTGTAGTAGMGVSLAAPLRFDHLSGVDVSDAGTGITFSPATAFPHVSGDAVQALGSGITLDRPLERAHSYGAAVVNPAATMTGYQSARAPNQWFGGVLAASAGSIALWDAGGAALVDAVVYGSQQSSSSANGTIASPEIAVLEGDQGKGGCIAVVPNAGRGFGRGAAVGATDRSIGRYPDGFDTDSLCSDFLLQVATVLPIASPAGATNIKVASVAALSAGQSITIGTGSDLEVAVIATVGTAGATTAGAATGVGATVIPVASSLGFSGGQAIIIDGGSTQEAAVVASTSFGGRGGRGGGRGGAPTITVDAPLKAAHAAGVEVAGTGVSLTAPLTRSHAGGAQVATSVPTPGAANRYDRPRR
jgi:non-reducing end alpha-L-arabinofuranosidase